MKYAKQLKPVLKSVFDTAYDKIESVVAPHAGTYERLNERIEYLNQFNKNLRAKNESPKVTIHDPFLKKIYNNINYIPMTPSNEKYFKKCYSINDIDDVELKKHGIRNTLKHDLRPLNFSKARLQEFFSLVVMKAVSLVKSDDDFDYDYCKYAIVGPPGIGKTTLINYLFSINYTVLNKKRLILLRVDLNDVSTSKSSLEERLYSKWMRIFAKYYFRNKIDSGSFESKFTEWFRDTYYDYSFLKRYSTEQKEHVLDRYLTTLYTLHEDSSSEYEFSIKTTNEYGDESQPGISSEDFCLMSKLTLGFLQKKWGWGYIIVFDGFDSVSFDQIQYAEYERWCDEIKKLTVIKDNKLYKGVYLITLRDYSYLKFHYNRKQCEDYDTCTTLPSYITLYIDQQNLQEIIEKRFLYLKMKCQYSAHNNLKRNLINLMYMCYMGSSPQSALKSTWENVTDLIQDIFANNYRLFFRFLRELLLLTYATVGQESMDLLASEPEALEYLKRFRGIEWRVIQLFITGTTNIKPFRNRTKYDVYGQPKFDNATPIIPNIFNFNEYSCYTLEAGENCNATKFENKILVKCRILQHLLAQNGQDGIIDVFGWIRRTFRTHWLDELRFETRELIFSNLLRCNLDEADMENTDYLRTNYVLTTTRKTNVIDRMLDLSIYYELVMDNTPIESRYARLFSPLHQVDRNDIWSYLKEKTHYIALFLCYLMRVESEEFTRTQTDPETIEAMRYRETYLIFSDKRLAKIKEDIVRYLNGYLEERQENVAMNMIAIWARELNLHL